jgi:alcohol dehydrogenase class IV
VRWVRALVAELKIPALRTYGVTSEQVSALVQNAAQASSMKANPLPLTADELTALLRAAV